MLSLLSKRNDDAIELPSVPLLLHLAFYCDAILNIIAFDSCCCVVVKFDWLLSCSTPAFSYVFL